MDKEIYEARPVCTYCPADEDHPDGVYMQEFHQIATGHPIGVWWQCPRCGSRSPFIAEIGPVSHEIARKEAHRACILGRQIRQMPLSRDAARDLDRNTILWIERRPDDFDDYPPLEIWVRVGGYKRSITIYFDGCVGLTTEDEIDWSTYGIKWRAWLACPEDEHRDAAAWKAWKE